MKGKKQRVIEANVFSGAKKKPLISSTNEDLKTAFFSAFTIVDWSKDNKRVLLKEKTGSPVRPEMAESGDACFLKNFQGEVCQFAASR